MSTNLEDWIKSKYFKSMHSKHKDTVISSLSLISEMMGKI